MSKNVITLGNFFAEDYTTFSKYDNVRKIASYIDGQKNAARKIVHGLLGLRVNDFVKVSNLGPRIQDYSQYLHGSLEATVCGMTADYVGSGNNMPLLSGSGNFGSTFIPAPSATRYISAKSSPVLKQLFKDDDNVNLIQQMFEGEAIEPRFFVPTLPLIVINGSEGVSVGFAQKIFPRNPKDIIRWLHDRATKGKAKASNIMPYWAGMTCSVTEGDTPQQWVLTGGFTRQSKTSIVVTSLPIGYTLKDYQNVLDALSEKDIIKGYDDESDNDIFRFVVRVDKKFTANTDDWIIDKLKLTKRMTENFTCVDEDNKIVTFNDLQDLLEAWYNVRIRYNKLRRQYIAKKLSDEHNALQSRLAFVTAVVDKKLIVANRDEQTIIADAAKCSIHLADPEVVKKQLTMPIRALTQEEITRLKSKIASVLDEIKIHNKLTDEDLILTDIKEFKL